MRVKSSSFSRTSADEAIARRCSTAFVDPPSAITTVIAFSNDLRVMMRRGVSPNLIKLTTAAPARPQSSRFWEETASCAELFGKLMPIASIADAMVLAVYIPEQDPGPGMAVRSTNFNCCSVTDPCA